MVTYVLLSNRGRWEPYTQVEMVTQLYPHITIQLDNLRKEKYDDDTCVIGIEVQTWTGGKCLEAKQYDL